ncbi:MAG TPA: hypothetical protein VFN71_02665, partial [Methylomirabilota bacterium]|nr:hypothetical protein [Methylomirabilota bacterium]
ASLLGNGALTITGSLFNFQGTGNKVTVNNSVCGGPCQMIGGIPVLISGGGSINVNNPVKNLTGNTITYSSPSTALLTVNGKGTITVQGK